MTVNEVELIGGPKHGQKVKVPNIDNVIKLPVLQAPVNDVQPGGKIVRYDIAVYQRNIFMPEFFNYLRLESDLRDTTGLDSLDAGLEPPE